MQEIKIRLGDAQFTVYPEKGTFFGSNEWGQAAHFHAYYEIHVIKSGSAKLVVHEKHIDLNEGDICLFAPNVSHYTDSYDGNLLRCSLMFNTGKVGSIIEGKSKGFSEYSYYSQILKSFSGYLVIKDDKIMQTITEIREHDFSDKNVHKIKVLLSLFFIHLCQHIEKGFSDKDDQKERDFETDYIVKQKIIVEKFFYERYNDKITIEDLADGLCLSVCQTNRIVKKIFGTSFKKLLVKQRVENACMLIKQGKYTLDEIALMSGYSSYNGFFYAFKNFMGKTPEEYKLQKLTDN